MTNKHTEPPSERNVGTGTSQPFASEAASVEKPAVVFDHQIFLKSVTEHPGIYQMYDVAHEPLYVGKAKNLRKRLSSYFRQTGLAPKTQALVARIASIEVTVTNTETEALLLEQNLIKKLRPPYNILLRDDKSYPYIFVSDHPFPRIAVHRGAKRGKGRYFGPYPSALAVRDSLSFLQKVFKMRQCEDSFFNNRSRPCLQYQINRCTGPCVNKVSEEEYAESVRHTTMFLEGKNQSLINELANAMEQASADLAFEHAAELRDMIQQLQQVQSSQFIEGESGNLDIIACELRGGSVCVQLLFVRDGRVLGSKSYFPRMPLDSDEGEVISAFMAQYYIGNQRELPAQIVVSHAVEDVEAVAQALSDNAGRKVTVAHGVRSHRAKWLALAANTASQNLNNQLASRESMRVRYESLMGLLQLESAPMRMECFDISHSHGEATVASCVVFDSDGPLRADYRRFNIKGITAGDDYAAMHQALTRRYQRVKNGDAPMPDILVIDGGKGQVQQAREVLETLGIASLLVLGVAKGPTRKAGFEQLIRGDNGHVFTAPSDAPGLHLLQHIRDEAHRFAVTGHKQQRDKKRRQSVLEAIPGIGPKKRRELLRHFGGRQEIAAASVDDLMKVPGINEKLARDIYATFRGD